VSTTKNDRRTIFGWAMYDWANSAYSTVIAGAVLPAYFVGGVVGDDGWNGRSGDSLWALGLALGTLLLFIAMPVLGAVADYSASKKRFLRAFAYGGSLFITVLIFAGSGDVLFTLGFFLLAQLGFVGANVFYDGFLPDITTPDTIDKVSSRGFALGYVGGGLWLAVVLAGIFIAPEDQTELVTRIGVAATGLWWAGFTWFSLRRLPETGDRQAVPDHIDFPRNWHRGVWTLVGIIVVGVVTLVVALVASVPFLWFNVGLALWMVLLAFLVYRVATSTGSSDTVQLRSPFSKLAGIGFSRMFRTAAQLRNFPHLLLFIVAYMFYNDGVQTTINISSAYASGTLELSVTDIALTFLVVQFVAFGGALAFGWLSSRIGIRRSIQANLVIWVGVAIVAYNLPVGGFLPFIATGVVIGLVLGGIQALSRSLYGSMIPESASAEFYGFYSVFAKFSAIWGPLVFAIVSTQGNSRVAILSVILFFVLGLVLFSMVDIERARSSKDDWELSEA
jgi:UMF1 family MFS transporter